MRARAFRLLVATRKIPPELAGYTACSSCGPPCLMAKTPLVIVGRYGAPVCVGVRVSETCPCYMAKAFVALNGVSARLRMGAYYKWPKHLVDWLAQRVLDIAVLAANRTMC